MTTAHTAETAALIEQLTGLANTMEEAADLASGVIDQLHEIKRQVPDRQTAETAFAADEAAQSWQSSMRTRRYIRDVIDALSAPSPDVDLPAGMEFVPLVAPALPHVGPILPPMHTRRS